MYKIYKLNVIGNEYIDVDMKTGKITGKTYNAKDWIKRNFEATWDKENKCWKADPEVIAKEFENHNYYDKYISDVETIVEDDDVVEESTELKVNGILVNPSEIDLIIKEDMVNRNDGFYVKETRKSGRITYRFLG